MEISGKMPSSSEKAGKRPLFDGEQGEAVRALQVYEEAVVSFVGALMDKGLSREEVESFHRAEVISVLEQKSEEGHALPDISFAEKETEELEAAGRKVQGMYSRRNWKTLADAYFEGALNAYEDISKQTTDESKAAA